MKKESKFRQANRQKLTFTFIVNASEGLPSPSYQIRLNPLIEFLKKNSHEVREVEIQNFLQYPFFSDVIVFQRYVNEDLKDKCEFLTQAIVVLRENSTTLVWDLDDDLFELWELQTVGSAESLTLMNFLNQSDICTVSTKNLMKRVARNEKTLFVPNQPLRRFKKAGFRHPNEKIEIGYLGNFDREMDIFKVLSSVSRHYVDKQIVFHTYGLSLQSEVQLSTQFSNIEVKNYSPMPYQRVLKHYSKLKLHCSIAPLSNSSFNESKSAIKFIDYALNRAPIFMSSVGEVSELVSDYALLPPLDSIDSEKIWIENLSDVLKKSKSLLERQNSSRLQFQVSRNNESQRQSFSELMFLIRDRLESV